MVTEGVPGQVAYEAVVLMEVVARVRKHEIRIDAGLQILEDILHRPTLVGQIAVAEREDLDRRIVYTRQELLCAASRLVHAVAVCREHQPMDVDVGPGLRE